MTVPWGRRHDLDAIRASALLLGIVLHSCLSFMTGVGGELWPVGDHSKSSALAVLFFVIHVFRMTVFFLIAGLLSRALLTSLGWQGFVQNRGKRVLLPLVVAWPPCFVLVGGAAVWAMARANGGALPDPFPAEMIDHGLNFLHLWFLYELLWLYALTLIARAALHALDREGAWLNAIDAALRALLRNPLGVVVLALPVCVAMSLIPQWELWMGIPTPGFTLLPQAHSLFIYGYVFALGWALDRQRGLLNAIAQRWAFNGVLGLVCVVACLVAYGRSAQWAGHPAITLVLAVTYGLAVVAWTLAFVGLGTRFFQQPNPLVRYMADASYWMYIAHLPLVIWLQTAFMLAPLHWSVKFVLINVLCFAASLTTYHWWVRSTRLGRLLNGSIKPRVPLWVALRGGAVAS